MHEMHCNISLDNPIHSVRFFSVQRSSVAPSAYSCAAVAKVNRAAVYSRQINLFQVLGLYANVYIMKRAPEGALFIGGKAAPP